MNATYIVAQWNMLCRSATSTLARLQAGASPSAVELMRIETERFCSQNAPKCKDELEAAYTQRMALSARLTAITRADAMAGDFPHSAASIYVQLREFCRDALPTLSDDFLAMTMRNMELTRCLANICEQDLRNGHDARV